MRTSRLLLALLLSPAALAQDAPPADPPKADADPPGFWTPGELRLLDEGLDLVNASRKDLGFQKRPIDDPFRLEVVDRVLDGPLSIGAEAQAWDEVVRRGDAAGILLRALDHVAGGRFGATMAAGNDPVEPLPPEAARPYRILANHTLTLGDQVRIGLAPLRDRRAAVLRAALKSQVQTPNWTLDPPEIDDAAFREAVLGLERRTSLLGPAHVLLGSVEALARAIQSAATKDSSWTGTERFSDEFGGIVISGYGDDVHDEGDDVAIVIDLGGNDTWLRGARASVELKRPISVVLDLSGDDRYVGSRDLSFGAALGGIAIQWDCGGNDVYLGGNASCGAGILGVGVLVDEGGDDVFRVKDFGLGAGAFGVGLLLKKGGNDLYHADLFGQGFASTWGCGVLADTGGNDTYDAGGAHVHAPLFRDRYQSLSQGFAIGNRPDASGGVGVLVDVAGNDRYVADIYAQGSSYWYSLGLLIDDDGHDTYVAGQYSIGAGIHLSAGMLLDRAGNDSYHCLNGVGVGGAHDFAVGFLVDRGGDDHYSGSGGSQGGALTNSVAVLLDGGGDDGYTAVREGSQGYASPARGTGGIGLCLDAGGKDVWSERTRDGGVWTKEVTGAGIDEPSESAATGEPQAAAMTKEEAEAKVLADGRTAADGAEPAWDLDKLWKLASLWEVNDNRVLVPIAREKLWALGAPALDRAFERIATKDGLEFRAVESTLAKFPREDVVPRLVAKLGDEDAAVRKGALAAIVSLKPPEAYDRLVEMLASDEASRRGVLAALGALKKAPPEVAALLRSKNELEGVNAATCLGAVGDDAAIDALLGALGDDTPFLVRTAATEQLAALGETSVPRLAEIAADTTKDVRTRRNALRAMCRSKSLAAVEPLLRALKDAEAAVRLAACMAASDLANSFKPTPDAPGGSTPPVLPREEREARGLAFARLYAAVIQCENDADPRVRRWKYRL